MRKSEFIWDITKILNHNTIQIRGGGRLCPFNNLNFSKIIMEFFILKTLPEIMKEIRQDFIV